MARSLRRGSDSAHVLPVGLRPPLRLDFAASDTQRKLLTVNLVNTGLIDPCLVGDFDAKQLHVSRPFHQWGLGLDADVCLARKQSYCLHSGSNADAGETN